MFSITLKSCIIFSVHAIKYRQTERTMANAQAKMTIEMAKIDPKDRQIKTPTQC